MSNTAHGVGCRCQKCQRLNSLSGKAFKLSARMLEAKKNGEDEKVEALCAELEQADSERDQLMDELGR